MKVKNPNRTLSTPKKVFLLLGLLLLSLFSKNVFASSEEAQAASEETEAVQISNIIAHAGGAIIGEDRVSIYTNSPEAIEANYALGFRTFEMDLELTSDGKIASVHDWDDYGLKNGKPMSSEEWLAAGSAGKDESEAHYTSLLFEDILDIMEKYPDIVIVTDTKYSDERASQMFTIICDTVEQKDPALFDRLVPQIYTNEMYDVIMELYPWKNIIYTTYNNELSADEIIDFCASKYNIHIITSQTHDKRFGTKQTKKIHENGMLVYKHTIDNVLTMAKFAVKDVDGYYTNMISPEEMERVTN